MRHAGDGALSAGANIGRRACDRAGDAEAAEERGPDIGDALSDQFAVRAMASTGHPVGDHGRKERLDGAEKREGERGRQNLDDPGHGQIGQRGSRQDARDGAEPRPDRVHRKIEKRHHDGGGGDRDEHAWPGRPKAADHEDDGDRAERSRERHRFERSEVLPERGELGEEGARFSTRHGDAGQFADLAGENDGRDPAVKPTVTG